ncbi:MAG: extracellular solute-binding protein [Clostridiales bacterium]|nr:extracellular solute-binding protein [Clostridiales bacterium]
MKDKLLRAISLILVLAIVIIGAVSCGGSGGDSGSPDVTDADAAPAEETTAETGINDNLPDLDYKGSTVKIHTFGYKDVVRYDGKGEGETGDILDDAVYARNLATEERLKVKLEYTNGTEDWGGFANEVQKMVLAGDYTHDFVMLESSQCFRLMLNGYFRELTDLPYIDIEQPWWYKTFMDGGAIRPERYYFVTGAFSITTLLGGSCTIFNKSLFDNYFGDHNELYDKVENNEWTHDAFIKYCMEAYTDVNGDGAMDKGDIVGFYNRGQTTVNYTSMSVGLPFMSRDSEGLPVLELGSEQALEWVEILYRMLYEDNISYPGNYDEGLPHFVSGNAIFYLGMLSDFIDAKLRAMSMPYGILPMPVMNENLEYMSAAGTVNGMSAILPVTTPDDRLEISGAVLESLSIEAYRTVIPAFYDIALKAKYADTERDSDMVDIIYNTIDTSFIMIADKLLGTGSFFFNCVVSSKKTPGEYMSYYESKSPAILKQWDDMIVSFLALGEQ